jgi:hypothetical protein
VAICFLLYQSRKQAAVAAAGLGCVAVREVSPEFRVRARLYPVINAYVGLIDAYLGKLERFGPGSAYRSSVGSFASMREAGVTGADGLSSPAGV